jgi:hypothetical protein
MTDTPGRAVRLPLQPRQSALEQCPQRTEPRGNGAQKEISVSQVNTNPCPIAREYAAVIGSARSKRTEASDTLAIILWGQVANELQRFDQRHVQGCAVCLEHEAERIAAEGRNA